MRQIFQLLLVALPFTLKAQNEGIRFEHGLSWTEVQAKAKAEKKYIFMDCFTTWCGPCKYMSAKVFTQAEVGEFFNKNFINVKVQMDQTNVDNDEVKKWYADARAIEQQYGVKAYPTFLYFSPEGKLVHRVVGGGEAKDFITKSSAALDPSTQYYTVLENFNKKKKKEPADIRNMAYAARSVYDQEGAAKYAADYLATQKNLLTKENAEFLDAFTNSSKDKGFEFFLNQGDKMDELLGEAVSTLKVKQIILREEVYPNLRRDGNAPEWENLQAGLAKKYPAYAGELISGAKVQYYQMTRDWPNFQTAVMAYMKQYGEKVPAQQLNAFAWSVFENCADPACIEQALTWSKRSLAEKEDPSYLDTYANLLYKLGRKDEAIAAQEKAVALSNGDKELEQTLQKMKNGEKTWNN